MTQSDSLNYPPVKEIWRVLEKIVFVIIIPALVWAYQSHQQTQAKLEVISYRIGVMEKQIAKKVDMVEKAWLERALEDIKHDIEDMKEDAKIHSRNHN